MSRLYPRMRIDQIRQPSQKIAVGDSRRSDLSGKPSASETLGPGKSDGSGPAFGGGPFGWHMNTVNVLFFDGHAASFHGPETPSMGLFMLWTRRLKTFAYSDTQSADESGWWLR